MPRDHAVDFSQVTPAAAAAVAETMQSLATPSRVRILARLAVSPCTVTKLARELGMCQPAISQQLRVLRHLGLVVGTREGRNVSYALYDEHVLSLLREALAHTEHFRAGLSDSFGMTSQPSLASPAPV